MILLLLALLLHRPTSPHVPPLRPTVTAAHVSAPAVRTPSHTVRVPWTPPPRRPRPGPPAVPTPAPVVDVPDVAGIPVIEGPPNPCPEGSVSYLTEEGWRCDG